MGAAVAAAALAALAAIASTGSLGGGYWQSFTGLCVAGLVVAVCVARPRPGSVELSRLVALVWVCIAAWAAFLLAGAAGQASSPPPGPPELFLGIPVTVFHVAAMYGGALLVAVAAFGTRRAPGLRIGLERT